MSTRCNFKGRKVNFPGSKPRWPWSPGQRGDSDEHRRGLRTTCTTQAAAAFCQSVVAKGLVLSDLLGFPHTQKDPELYGSIFKYWHLILLLLLWTRKGLKMPAFQTQLVGSFRALVYTNQMCSFRSSFIWSEGFTECYLRRQAKCEQETQSLLSQSAQCSQTNSAPSWKQS